MSWWWTQVMNRTAVLTKLSHLSFMTLSPQVLAHSFFPHTFAYYVRAWYHAGTQREWQRKVARGAQATETHWPGSRPMFPTLQNHGLSRALEERRGLSMKSRPQPCPGLNKYTDASWRYLRMLGKSRGLAATLPGFKSQFWYFSRFHTLPCLFPHLYNRDKQYCLHKNWHMWSK